MLCNSNNFLHNEKILRAPVDNSVSQIPFLSQSDKNSSSSTTSRFEKCSFEKNALKNFNFTYLLSEAFDAKGCNFENIIFISLGV